MSSNQGMNKRGQLKGNGSARSVKLGFKPDRVELYNITDQTDLKKVDSMPDAKCRKEVAAGTKTYVDGITIDSDGFTIEAAEFVADKEYHYYAVQEVNE